MNSNNNEKLKFELSQEIIKKTGINGYVSDIGFLELDKGHSYQLNVRFKPHTEKVVSFYGK